MQIALPNRAVDLWTAVRERSDEVRSLENWLLCWILLPNAPYWLLWIIGGPPRGSSIFIVGLIGLMVHRASFPVKFGAFCLAIVLSIFFFIAALFNLSLASLADSIRFAGELQPGASVEYIACGIGLAATLGAAWWALRRPTTLADRRKLIIAICLLLISTWIDKKMSEGSRGSYKRTPDASVPFNSARSEAGLDRLATGERHVMMVMVEAMGLPTDPRVRQRLIDLWATPEVRARYDVLSGDSLYFGSTTNAEMRELCGRWSEYHELRERRDETCLPYRLAARGYEAKAWHSFNGEFFNRTIWYPNIGFQKMLFADDLRRAGADFCPGVFAGACDRDIPRMIAAEVKRAKKPQFLYWLTVNSHVPVIENERLGTANCARFDARLAEESPHTCRLMQLFNDAGASLAREIVADDFPATDILIVGDHIPPFFDRHHREQFAPDSVPWILLRPKGSAPAGPRPIEIAARH